LRRASRCTRRRPAARPAISRRGARAEPRPHGDSHTPSSGARWAATGGAARVASAQREEGERESAQKVIADKSITDVTVEDIDERFASGSWAAAGGNMQSMLFAATALQHIPHANYKLVGDLVDATMLDYGCAEGDGTA